MSDELNKNEMENLPEQAKEEKEEVMVKTPVEQQVEEPQQEEEKTLPPVEAEVIEEAKVEEQQEQPDKAEEEPSPEQPDKAEEQEQPAEEQKPAEEEQQKEKVEKEEDEDLPTVEDFERVQAELEEIKNAEADRQVMQQLQDRDAAREQQLRAIEGQLADRLELELNRYGIDLNKSLAELQKEDAAKFQIAQGLINQSRAQAEQARAFMEEQKAADAREAIFNKAGMLMAKYDLAEDEANSVAETFLDIIDAAGVRDLGEDLKNKVELAVAKVRFVGGKLKKAVKETKEAVEAIKETADAVVEAAKPAEEPPKAEEKIEQPDKTEQPDKAEEPVVTEDIKKEALAEAMGDAVPEANKNAPIEGDGATVENVLEKLMATPFKERVEFYKKHEALINEARKIQLRNESMNNGFFN
jgi:hypothetical protein